MAINGPIVSEYKGKPVLNLTPEERYPFSFGMAKAKLILDNLDAIRSFVASEGKTCESKPAPMRPLNLGIQE